MELQLAKKQHLHNNPGFVIGNGTSRQCLDLRSLATKGVTYGCNAQYREFEPHYLIAVDVKMVNEIIESGYNKKHQVWTNPNKGIQTKHSINFFSPHKGWSSGPTALWFAATQEHQTIYILASIIKAPTASSTTFTQIHSTIKNQQIQPLTTETG